METKTSPLFLPLTVSTFKLFHITYSLGSPRSNYISRLSTLVTIRRVDHVGVAPSIGARPKNCLTLFQWNFTGLVSASLRWALESAELTFWVTAFNMGDVGVLTWHKMWVSKIAQFFFERPVQRLIILGKDGCCVVERTVCVFFCRCENCLFGGVAF